MGRCLHRPANRLLILLRSPSYLRDMEILRLMLQFELQNFELLPALIKSVTNQLKNLHMLGDFEKAILHFFGKVRVGNIRQTAQQTIIQLEGIDPSHFNNQVTNKFLEVTPFVDWFRGIAQK